MANSLSPFERTEDRVKVVGFNRLKLLARDLSLWRDGNEAEVSDQDLRTNTTYSRGAQLCAPTDGALTLQLRKS